MMMTIKTTAKMVGINNKKYSKFESYVKLNWFMIYTVFPAVPSDDFHCIKEQIDRITIRFVKSIASELRATIEEANDRRRGITISALFHDFGNKNPSREEWGTHDETPGAFKFWYGGDKDSLDGSCFVVLSEC